MPLPLIRGLRSFTGAIADLLELGGEPAHLTTTPIQPATDSIADIDLRWRLGSLILSYAPDSVDGELLLEVLRHSTLGEVIGDAAAAIADCDQGEQRDGDLARGARR